jgi:predicted Zn-dependent protease with MMP-like domain
MGFMWLSNAEFDQYVCQAIDSLDESFRKYIEEVPVIVEDLPDHNVRQLMGLKKSEILLGLFRGVPLNRQSVESVSINSPNQIFLYRQNILKCCHSVKQVAEQIRKTVIHELGHYLGFSEAELRKYHY